MIKRYDLINVPCHGGWDSYDELQEVEDGDWVRYDDHAAELERLSTEGLHHAALSIATSNALPDILAELHTLRARVAELEHEHDLSTSEGIRARIRELEAEVDVLTSELEVVEEAEAEEGSDAVDLDELERLEREAPRLQPGEWQPQDFLTTPQRGRFLAAICNALPDLIAELRTLRARVADADAVRHSLNEMVRVLDGAVSGANADLDAEAIERVLGTVAWNDQLAVVKADTVRYWMAKIEGLRRTIKSQVGELRAARDAQSAAEEEAESLRARVAELERDLDACRVELLEARHVVGEGWFADGATLAEGVARKCRMLEGDAEHWRRAAEARSLRAEDGDHALHRFAALAAAKNEGRSAITLTVWSDGTVDAEQYATLEGELDEWGTLYQERRASWGSRPIGELDALVDDLESGDWYTVEHRAPQGFWGEIAVLRDEVERLRDDIEMACENSPWPGCECPGCETARERAEAELNGGDR